MRFDDDSTHTFDVLFPEQYEAGARVDVPVDDDWLRLSGPAIFRVLGGKAGRTLHDRARHRLEVRGRRRPTTCRNGQTAGALDSGAVAVLSVFRGTAARATRARQRGGVRPRRPSAQPPPPPTTQVCQPARVEKTVV
ncbi:hypothetical protein GCM10010272_54080 [Streptomyces lateritius]|nr:hypothetical protein GCM10010272_54080 [Streptomyces lateritius]